MRLWLALAAVLMSATTAWAQPSPSIPTNGSEAFTADATTYTFSNSVTLTAGRLPVLVIHAVDGDAVTTAPTITGITGWREVANAVNSTMRIHVLCLNAHSGTSGTLAVQFEDAQSRAQIAVVEWAGAAQSGNCEDNILQKATHSAAADTNTTTVTFAAFSDTRNRPFLAIGKGVTGLSTNDWTELYDLYPGAESLGAAGTWNNSTADSDVVMTWANAAAGLVLGIEMEVVAASTADIQMGTGMCSGGFCD